MHSHSHPKTLPLHRDTTEAPVGPTKHGQYVSGISIVETEVILFPPPRSIHTEYISKLLS